MHNTEGGVKNGVTSKVTLHTVLMNSVSDGNSGEKGEGSRECIAERIETSNYTNISCQQLFKLWYLPATTKFLQFAL